MSRLLVIINKIRVADSFFYLEFLQTEDYYLPEMQEIAVVVSSSLMLLKIHSLMN